MSAERTAAGGMNANLGVIHVNVGPLFLKVLDQGNRGGLARIPRVGLEGKSKDSNTLQTL